jgi:hypothetical protein
LISIALGILSLIAAVTLWRCGDRDERAAVVLMAAVALLTPLVDHLQNGGLRWAVAVLDGLNFVGLVAIAFVRRRWWPIPLAGCQLIVALTHVVGMASDHWVWTAVTVRIAAWCVILLILFFAAYEAHIVRRYGLETSNA